MKRRFAAALLLLLPLLAAWANENPSGDIQAWGTVPTLNLTGGGELSFRGNIVLESDGQSIYMSPANDTTGSIYFGTGGVYNRGSVSSLGAWLLNGNTTIGGNLTANGSMTVAGNANVTGNLAANGYAYVRGNGPAAHVVDFNVPLQLSTGADGTESYLGANKAGAYGFLLGYSNRGNTPWPRGGLMRMVTADNFSFVMNNNTYAATFAASGDFSVMQNVNVAGSLAVNGNITAPNFNIGHIGAYDALSRSVAYFADDFMATSPTNALHSFATSGTGNVAYIGMVASNDVVSFNSSDPNTVHHPGNLTCGTVVVGYCSVVAFQEAKVIQFAADTGVTLTDNIMFRTPKVLSNPNNRYVFRVGPFQQTSGSPIKGFFLKYSDDLNGGSWMIGQWGANGGSEVITNTTTPVLANTWYNLTITYPPSGTTVTFALNGAPLGGTTTQTIIGNNIAPAAQAPSSPASMLINRTVSDGTTMATGYIDRVSVYITGLNR